MSVQYIVSLKGTSENSAGTAAVFTGDADTVVEWLKTSSDVSNFQIWDVEQAVYLTVDQFLRGHVIPSYYTQLVPKYYQMDPKTEDMLPNGKYLANGMKVITADPDSRERPEDLTNGKYPADWIKEKLLTRNRWCVVTHVEITNDGKTISFIGAYEDGTKRQYRMGVGQAWIVKVSSIEDSLIEATAKFQEVKRVITETFDKHGEYCCTICNGGSDAPSDESLAEEATSRVLGLLR